MSRCLRQPSQLARLARLSQTPRIHRALQPSLALRAAKPAAWHFTSTATAPWRPYSTSRPDPEESSKKPAKEDEQKEKKTGENNGNGNDDLSHKADNYEPLKDGWIHLSSKEFEQLREFTEALTPGQKESLGSVLKDLKVTGVPAEVRDILQKMKEGTGRLGVIDKGRLLRATVQISHRVAELQVKRESNNTNEKGQDGRQQGDSKENHDQGANTHQSQQSRSGSDQQQKGPNFTGGGPSPGGSGFSEALQSVLVTGAALWLWNTFIKGSNQKEVTWQEVRTNFLDKGLVKKFVVQGEKVRVDLQPDAPLPATAGDGGAPPVFYFSIGSAELLERNVLQAQDELGIPPSKRIPISYEGSGSSLGNLFLAFGPTLLFIGLIIWTQRSMGGGRGAGGGVFSFGKSKAKKFNAESAVKVKFSDVAGLEEAKTEIMEFVSFLKQPEKFEKLGAKIPRGAILAGPPGTGKTLLAKATAGESGVPFFSVSGSEFVEMFVGVGPSRVRDLFAEGRKNAPCIIFIDEIDAIGRARQESGKGFGGNDEREATLNQILTEMDGFNTREQVVVLAGTNRADVLDRALMRPGRFDRHIFIDRPTMQGRKEIFQVYLKKIVTNEDQEHLIGRLATLTPGFSGADISNVVNEAALIG